MTRKPDLRSHPEFIRGYSAAMDDLRKEQDADNAALIDAVINIGISTKSNADEINGFMLAKKKIIDILNGKRK